MRVTVSPEQIRSAFEAVKDDPSFDESRGLWERGRPPVEMIQAMCLRPEILRGVRRLRELRLPRRAARAAGQGAGDHHRLEDQRLPVLHGLALRSRGHRRTSSTDPLVVIDHPESLAPRERLAIEYTRAAMADSNAIPEPLVGELHEHFTDPELVELTFLIGYINMLNLFNNCLEVRYNGEYSELFPVAG